MDTNDQTAGQPTPGARYHLTLLVTGANPTKTGSPGYRTEPDWGWTILDDDPAIVRVEPAPVNLAAEDDCWDALTELAATGRLLRDLADGSGPGSAVAAEMLDGLRGAVQRQVDRWCDTDCGGVCGDEILARPSVYVRSPHRSR